MLASLLSENCEEPDEISDTPVEVESSTTHPDLKVLI